MRGSRNLTWRRSDSNRRPPACKAGALPTELRPQRRTPGPTGPTRRHPAKSAARMGQGGLEPPTPRLSSVCSNQLSYWPKNQSLGWRAPQGAPRLPQARHALAGTAQGRMRGQRPFQPKPEPTSRKKLRPPSGRPDQTLARERPTTSAAEQVQGKPVLSEQTQPRTEVLTPCRILERR
jgi:hypothetical protein